MTVKAAISEKGWSERRSSSNYPVKEITTKSSASAGNLTSYSLTSKLNTNLKQNVLLFFRNANKQEIIKAYRKLAQQWHPDNFQSETEKKEAEKKFIDIASAKEVLTDPGLMLNNTHFVLGVFFSKRVFSPKDS